MTLLQKLQIGVGIGGIVLVIAGVVVALRESQGKRGEDVEIIETNEIDETTEIIVDVGGAVENPGVYRLTVDSRVGDALTAAGGLGQDADRGWVARYLNLAQVVPDGAKIYIPRSGEGNDKSQITNAKLGEVAGVVIGPGQPGTININTASASDLDRLWGIGEKRAADIIANRPYQNVEELMTKAAIPKNVYERIKGEVTVY